MEPALDRQGEMVASTKPGTVPAGEVTGAPAAPANLRFQAKKEEAGTPLLRQNAATERPLTCCRSITLRHFRHAGDSDSLIGSKADACRVVRKGVVHVAHTRFHASIHQRWLES